MAKIAHHRCSTHPQQTCELSRASVIDHGQGDYHLAPAPSSLCASKWAPRRLLLIPPVLYCLPCSGHPHVTRGRRGISQGSACVPAASRAHGQLTSHFSLREAPRLYRCECEKELPLEGNLSVHPLHSALCNEAAASSEGNAHRLRRTSARRCMRVLIGVRVPEVPGTSKQQALCIANGM